MKKTIYIFSSGELKRKGNTIYFEGESGKKYIPVENTQEIMVFGEVDVNKRFLEFITQAGIILHFFNHYDYYVGSFYPREHLNSGYMILKQAEHYLDETSRRKIAAKFVTGASRNMQSVLRYYMNREKEVGEVLENVRKLEEKIDGCGSTGELMAIEGNMREHYYGAFDIILKNPDFSFERRSRRPPENLINALISFGNSLIYTIALSEIYKTHLDPRIGFLHTTNFRKFSLNLDVAEIFKPVIVDRVIFKVIGKRMITGQDFDTGAGGLRLKEKAMKLFVQEIEDKLATTIKHRTLGKSVSYRRLIRLELYKLQKHLMGEEEYEPFVARW